MTPRRSAIAVALAAMTGIPLLSGPASAQSTTPDALDSTIWRQSFDSLRDDLLPRAEDPGIPPGTIGFTHDGPRGWSVENDDSMEGVGVEEWRGWSFTTRDFWTDAEDQRRFRFGRSLDVIAVADSDEFHDLNPGEHTYDTTLVSAPVDVSGQARLELSFDSHYRSWHDQVGTVTVRFDGGAEQEELVRLDDETVEVDDDVRALNANVVAAFDVPSGAEQAVFRWRLTAPMNSWYWAIDNVALREPLPEAAGSPTSLWAVSDVQGHPWDLARGIVELNEVRPDAEAMIMAGDIVNSGSEAEWAEIYDVMDEAADLLPDQVIAAIGNHESYTGEPWEVLRDRFLEFAERDRVYGEYVVRGEGGTVPVLVLGQEFDREDRGEVGMSGKQVRWFNRRLDRWTEREKQVIVTTHFPLGDTVSASWIPWYHESHERNDRLTKILGEHPNAILLTGHTHYSFDEGDWAVQRRVRGGHRDGFWAINTGAMHVGWQAVGESTETITEVTTGDVNTGLTLDVYDDRVVVVARDFGLAGSEPGSEVLRHLEIPNPFTSS